MSYTQILAVISSHADDADTLSVAAQLAKQHGAMVQVLAAFPRVSPSLWSDAAGVAYFSPEAWEAIIAGEKEMLEKAQELVRDTAKRFGLEGDSGPRMVLAPDSPTLWGGLLRELPLIDLVVAGHGSVKQDGPFGGVLDAALMDCRAPLLIVRAGEFRADAPAMVAWDGSLQAGRALRAAMPLLIRAGAVRVVQDPERLSEAERAWADPKRVADYLRQGGAGPVSVMLITGQWPGLGLAQTAVEEGTGLIVAGAYGHARLREALFGGATQAFLTDADGPHLLIAH